MQTPNEQHEPIFRPFLTEADEPLVAPQSPQLSIDRLAAFHELTGIDPSVCVVCPTTAIPVPVYPPQWSQGRRRWDGLVPEFAWHPLCWLPSTLAGRFSVRHTDGSYTPEDDQTWAARVLTVLEQSGLYRKEEGTWVDVCSLFGIDLSDPQWLARLEQWLDGAEDEAFDAIDLGKHLPENEDPGWAVGFAQDQVEVMNPVLWVLTASELLEDLSEVDDRSNPRALRAIAVKASFGLGGMRSEDTLWEDLRSRSDLGPADADVMQHRLEQILADHIDHARAVTSLGEEHEKNLEQVAEASLGAGDEPEQW